MWLWHTNGSPNLDQKTRPYNNKKKVKIFKIVDFNVPADHRIKLKECENRNNYYDLAIELKNYETRRRQLYQLWLGFLAR